MCIRLAQFDELESISVLMLEVFQTHMQKKYSDEGQKAFIELIALSSLKKRFLSGNLFYISLDKNYIKGVLELEKPCHIAFLFVKEPGEGRGKGLCSYALEKSSQEACTVGAFEDSIGFYESLGFMKISEKRKANDMEFTLMAKVNT